MKERWQRVRNLFERALELTGDERTRFLESECKGDPETLKEVTDLIASSSGADEFLERDAEHGLGDMEEELPRMLGERFELLRVLGQGGMGVVYYAREVSLDRFVAIKIQSRAAMLTRTQVERFHREAQAAAKLIHPNITRLHSAEREGDLHFHVLEYIAGHDLAAELKLQRGSQDAAVESLLPLLPPRETSRYIAAIAAVCRQIADALQTAHDAGVIHRDIKPNNILLDTKGVPHLVDFGLAKLENVDSATLTGEQAGSPHYMSPEQVRSGVGGVDYRTDIYSLGVVLYEQLAFRRPFEAADTFEIFELIRTRDPIPLRKANGRVPRDLETICQKAFAKDPAARYATAGEFGEDLDRFLNHEAIQARPPGYAERALRRLSRHRFQIAATVIILAGLFWSSRLGVAMERMQKLEGQVDGLLEFDDLLDPTVEDLLNAKNALDALSEQKLPGEGERARASLKSKIRGRVEQLRTEGKAGISMNGEGASEGAQVNFLDGWGKIRDGRRLAPEDDELRALASGATLLPRLTLRGNCDDASVYIRRIRPGDGLLERKIDYGSFPINDAIVPIGYFRIFVVTSGGDSAEYARNFSRPGYSAVIDVKIRSTEAVTRDMQWIPAGRFPFGGGFAVPNGSQRNRSLELEAFFCDVAEVSIAEFAEFVDRTGYEAGEDWGELRELLPEDRPVTGINWESARAYAEWAGKRLLTHAEWERAARGASGRSFPWGDDPRLDDELGNIEKDSPNVPAGSTRDREYALMLTSVRSHPEAATPEGIFHMYGNAQEFTETAGSSEGRPGGTNVLHTDMRILKGGDLKVKREVSGRIKGLEQVWGAPFYAVGQLYGFRCGKSADL